MTAEDLAAWKRAIADHHKQQRQQRGRRVGGASTPKYQPGMNRQLTVRTEQDGDQSNDGPWHDLTLRVVGGPEWSDPSLASDGWL